MPAPGASAAQIVLSEDERAELVRRAEGPGRWRADRARIILACAEGMSNAEAAQALGVAVKSGSEWRGPVPPGGAGGGGGGGPGGGGGGGAGGRGGGCAGGAPGKGHALVGALDGGAQGAEQVAHGGDLAQVRPQAPPAGLLQAVHRPVLRGEGRRRRGAVPQPAGKGRGAVRG